MGTSVNQPSPKTAGWNAVAACYMDAAIPIDRAATEIWRAALHQDASIRQQLASPAVDACLNIGESADSPRDAVRALNQLTRSNQNTFIAELAKRAAVVKAAGGFPRESARAVLFRQITDYLISRDVAGYVGPRYRFKTIADIRAFKTKVSDVVAKKVSHTEETQKGAKSDWMRAFTHFLTELQK